MGWDEAERPDALVVRPTGKIDESSWQDFAARLGAAVDSAKAAGKPLVIDLAGVDHMSSRGLRALTIARKEAGGAVELVLAAPNARMREILAISRYDKIFRLADVVPE